MPKFSLLHPYLVVAPGVALVVEEHVALDVATLGLRHVQVQVSEPPAARHVVGGDEGDLQQVLAEVVGDGLQVVDGGQRHRELQHFVRLRGGFLQEEDVVRGEFAPGVPLNHGADHLHHLVVQLLLQHRHQVLLDVLAGRRDPKHLQLDMEAMFDIV